MDGESTPMWSGRLEGPFARFMTQSPDRWTWPVAAVFIVAIVASAIALPLDESVWFAVGFGVGLPLVLGLPVLNRRNRVQWSRRVRALAQARGVELRPISEATGACRIAGRVGVSRPASDQAPEVAAHLTRRWRSRRVAASHAVEQSAYDMRVLTEKRASGRFVVRDATGIAIVDPWEEGFEIVRADDHEPLEEITIELREGEHVEVVGTPRAAGPGDALDEIDRRPTIVLDGRVEPVVIIVGVVPDPTAP